MKTLNQLRYLRYIKVVIKKDIIKIFVITSMVSNTIFLIKNVDYQNRYKDVADIELEVLVDGNKEEKQYTNMYEAIVKKPEQYKGTKIYISIDKKQKDVHYGDRLKVYGKFIKPSGQRNYMGFSYKEYLKTKKIHGIVEIDSLEYISNGNISSILTSINNIGIKIKLNLDKIMSKEAASIVNALILGDTSKIDDETKDNFKNSSLLHILAISGMHISCIIEGLTTLSKKTIGKESSKKYIIIFLVFYAFLVKRSPAILRAVIMGIMQLSATMLKRKNDFWTSLGLSALIILILNPHSILNLGFQLTYLGTIGIVLLQKNINYLLKKYLIREDKLRVTKMEKRINKKIKNKEERMLSDTSVSLSAQVMILPIILYTNNIFVPYFLISSILISYVITYAIYLAFLTAVLTLISMQIAKIFVIPLELLIQSIVTISQISKLPFSKMYVTTPPIYMIILIYLLIIILNSIVSIFRRKKSNIEFTRETENKLYNIVHLLKYRVREFKRKRKSKFKDKKIYIQKVLAYIVIFTVLVTNTVNIKIIKNKLRINMIDIGQGDSCLIQTVYNRNILIDGGGALASEFDVGRSIVIPYLLDRGIKELDYVMVSHFDFDHVGGIISVLEELSVKNILIAEQIEMSNSYERLMEISKYKKIKVTYLKYNNSIKIDNETYLDILWPEEEQIKVNPINNNSLVCKLKYKEFSMCFTGDIEEIAEKKIAKIYKDKLRCNILKVAHHGSKTSSCDEIMKYLNPNIAIISVGVDNRFNHPSDEIIKKFRDSKIKVYRTDLMGEINILVDKNSNIQVNTFI